MRAIGKASMSSVLTILLNVAWYVTAAVLVIGVVLLVLGSNVAFHIDSDGPSIDAGRDAAMSIPVALNVEPGAHRVAAPSLGIDNARLHRLRGALRFPPVKGPLFVANLIIVFGSLALILWVLDQLRGLFRNLRDGHPFVSANAMRLRRIAWAVIFGELARTAVVFFESYYAMRHFSVGGFAFEARPHLNIFAIINGLIIFVIAEVFREGTRLDEEQSLTI
jgi:Protein of unknown function (DUF2975)